MDDITNNSDEERSANYYEKYIGYEVVLPDWKDEKIIGKVRKCIKYDDKSTG